MKELLLWLVVLTPTPKCIEQATKDNLTNCRQECRPTGMTITTWLPQEDCRSETVCDPIPNPKPIPAAKFEFRLEHPGWREQVDPCFEQAIKKVKLEDDSNAQMVFASSASISGAVVFSTTSTLITTLPGKKKKKGK